MNTEASVPPRILVVDDNLEIHADFAKILGPAHDQSALEEAERALFGTSTSRSDERFVLDFAPSGEIACERVESAVAEGNPYALVFMDIRMPPGWDGVHAASVMWRIDPQLQVVFCSAYSDYSWRDMVEKLGRRSDFLILRKPFDSIEVRQIAHGLTEKAKLVRELERLVAERTRELEHANERVRHELAARLELEKELQHAQRLEALGRLAAGVGHEINNPLTFMKFNLEMCRDELKRAVAGGRLEDPASLLEAVEEGLVGAERIRRIVEDVRQFAQSNEEHASRVEIHDAIESAARIVDSAMRYRAELVLDVQERVEVLADRQRLEQVFVNLLLNASHAFSQGRSDRNVVRVRTRREPSAVVVEIRDNGCGIAEDVLPRVFEPFFTTKPIGGGKGLGLSIVKGIVESFGGTVAIESELGVGTLVRLRLPAVPTAAAGDVRAVASARAAARAKVLVVDDDQHVLRTVARMLAVHDVVVTTSGKEAVEIYRRGGIDVVVCDVMMPGFGGKEIYDVLSAMGDEHVRRIVFITGGACTPEAASFLESVQNVCLEKPLDSGQLRELVHTMTSGELRPGSGT